MRGLYLLISYTLILILLSACGSKEEMAILISEPEGETYSYSFESGDNVLSSITVPASVQFNYEELKSNKITFEFSGETAESEDIEVAWDVKADLTKNVGIFDIYNNVKHLIEVDEYEDGYHHFKAGKYNVVALNGNNVIAEGQFKIKEDIELATVEKEYTEELKTALKEDGLLEEYERQEQMEALEVQDPSEINFNDLAAYAGEWKDETGETAFNIAFHEDGTGERSIIMRNVGNVEVEAPFQVIQFKNNELILNEEGRFLVMTEQDEILRVEGQNEAGIIFTYTR